MEDRWLRGFYEMYNSLTASDLEPLREWYHEDVVFVDPWQQLQGIDALSTYMYHSYQDLLQCHFVSQWYVYQQQQYSIGWVLTYQHRALLKGRPITIEGSTHLLLADQRVLKHQDYFDVGAMLYHHVPILGRVTRWLNKRVISG